MITRVKRQGKERNKKLIKYFIPKKDMCPALIKDAYKSIRKNVYNPICPLKLFMVSMWISACIRKYTLGPRSFTPSYIANKKV